MGGLEIIEGAGSLVAILAFVAAPLVGVFQILRNQDRTDAKLDHAVSDFAVRLTEMSERFTEMSAKSDEHFAEMSAKSDERFAKMDERFEKIEQQHFAERAKTDERLLAMDRRMANMESNASELRVHADYAREKLKA